MKSKQAELNEKLKRRLTGGEEEVENRLQNFQIKWSEIKEVLSLYKSDKFMNIEYICNGNCDKYVLDGHNYEFSIPENVLLEYGHEIKNVSKRRNCVTFIQIYIQF